MKKMQATIRHSISRARDSYGYNVVTLISPDGKRYKADGGGYDMIGSCIRQWLSDTLSQEQLATAKADGCQAIGRDANDNLHIDGMWGWSEIEKIADHAGITIERLIDQSNGKVNGILLTFLENEIA